MNELDSAYSELKGNVRDLLHRFREALWGEHLVIEVDASVGTLDHVGSKNSGEFAATFKEDVGRVHDDVPVTCENSRALE